MTICLMLILGISLAQGWGQPAMQEAELAAPEGMGAPHSTSGPEPGAPASEPWDADSWDDSGAEAPLLTPLAPDPPADVQETPPQEEEGISPAPAEETTQTDPAAGQSVRIATFWFILPRR